MSKESRLKVFEVFFLILKIDKDVSKYATINFPRKGLMTSFIILTNVLEVLKGLKCMTSHS